MTDIQNRKKDHIDLTLTDESQYRRSNGFDEFQFLHNALPELDLAEISTSAKLLGKSFSMPLFISSMTGGVAEAGPVNAIIAEVCEELNIPFGVGSQRAMLEDKSLKKTFSVVREKAPNAFICANIGGVQLIGGLPLDAIKALKEAIRANAIIVHLNPLQELMQPEGDRNFRGVLSGIEQLVKDCGLPVIVKETGAGISAHTARRLLNVGVKVIDIAGAGGTSWAKVENLRPSNKTANHQFNEWGIPAATALQEVASLQWERGFELIASGGIRSAFDVAKALCLGADFAAVAQPVIKAVKNGGKPELIQFLNAWKQDLKTIMLLLGAQNISALNTSHLFRKS